MSFLNDDYNRIIVLELLRDTVIHPSKLTEGWGTNEIARLVEKDMSYITALNHIHKLVEYKILIEKSDEHILELKEEMSKLFKKSQLLDLLENPLPHVRQAYKKSGKKYPLILNLEELFLTFKEEYKKQSVPEIMEKISNQKK